SARLPPALDGACAPHPGDPVTLAAATGRGDDGPGRTRQGAASRGRGADRGQDRWRAAVCGGVDQDGAGIRPAPGAGGALCVNRASAAAGDSHHAARLADGAAGSPGDREEPGATRGDAGARGFLSPVAGCLPVGRVDVATGAVPVGGGGVPLPAGAAATGDVPFQAYPNSGRRLSVLAEKYAAAVPSTHRAGARGAVSRDGRDPAR